jgi:hypothetical protein
MSRGYLIEVCTVHNIPNYLVAYYYLSLCIGYIFKLPSCGYITALQPAFFALPMIPVLSARSVPTAFTIHNNTMLSLHPYCKVYQ